MPAGSWVRGPEYPLSPAGGFPVCAPPPWPLTGMAATWIRCVPGAKDFSLAALPSYARIDAGMSQVCTPGG